MHHRVTRLHGAFFKFRSLFSEELVALLLVLFVFVMPVGATTRFENRSLFMNSTQPGVTTSYKISLDYMTLEPVGSLDMLFCISPIPYEPCVTPPGLDVSNAVLSDQTGETGFTILDKSTNHILLSRPSSMIAGAGSKSSYTFDNIVNPTTSTPSFSIRLKSLASEDGTGALVDFGSVKGQINDGIYIETQVPPMLIFCVAEQVGQDCSTTNRTYFTDMGSLSKDSTLTAQSQMAVGTNATGGFAITVAGDSLTAGTNVINALNTPTASQTGHNQFGINLVENSDLNIGRDPEGDWANAVASTNYAEPNKYMYVPGDVIAYSPNVSLMKKFTVSYIVNVSPNLRAGVYTTTINYIASGRF
jgi:hypothetical protein